jgi:hypothetical protein
VAALRERLTKRSYVMGLDVGQSQDPTAVCIIEKVSVPDLRDVPEGAIYVKGVQPADHVEWTYSLNLWHLARLPLGSPYPQQVSDITAVLNTAPLRGNCRLVLDRTGVGRPVGDTFKPLNPVLVNITGGESWRLTDDGSYSVSKVHLVSGFDAVTSSGLLTINRDEPEVQALLAEAADFRHKFTNAGASTFSARSGRHDDLLLAACLAVWWANQGERKLRTGTILWG